MKNESMDARVSAVIKDDARVDALLYWCATNLLTEQQCNRMFDISKYMPMDQECQLAYMCGILGEDQLAMLDSKLAEMVY